MAHLLALGLEWLARGFWLVLRGLGLLLRGLYLTLRGLQRRFRRLPRRTRQLCVRVAALALLMLAISFAWITARNAPPKQPENLCSIFEEKRWWYRAAKRSAKEWGVSEAIQLAIMYQESSFKARIKPPRRRFLWIFPGPRPSTAFGFSQALDGTWEAYRDSTGRHQARRDDFADAAHFIGWYADQTQRQTGLAKSDAYNLYLAYHEGPGGYTRGTHQRKAWLLRTARRVETRARRYQQQYESCRDRLEKWWIFW